MIQKHIYKIKREHLYVIIVSKMASKYDCFWQD